MRVIKYTHPEWSMDLFLNAEDPGSVDNHMSVIMNMNNDEDFDPSLLEHEETYMNKEEFDNLSEWDG